MNGDIKHDDDDGAIAQYTTVEAMSTEIEFGIEGSLFHVDRDWRDYREVGLVAEESGFDRIVVGDHVSIPVDVPNAYPYTSTGEFKYNSKTAIYDPFLLLTYYGALTNGVRLGTRVCIVPYRHPVLLAKHALTLDALSGGRFDFGVGAGWLPTEFEVLDVPVEERGRYLDEFLDLFTQVRETPELSFDGSYHSFQRTGFYPRPIQEDGPPICLGGTSGAAFRRLAQYGDEWMAPSFSPQDIQAARERIMVAWDDYNREGEPRVSTYNRAFVGTDNEYDVEGGHLTGTPDEIIETIQSYIDVGVTKFDLMFDVPADQVPDQIAAFSHEVLPSF